MGRYNLLKEVIKKFIIVLTISIFLFTNISVDIQFLKSIGLLFQLQSIIRDAYADTVQPYCPQADNGAQGVFDPNKGYCTVQPLDAYGKCPSPYVFSDAYKTCIVTPLCPGAIVWNSQTKTCETVTATPIGDTTPTFPDNSCAVDLNGNGEVEQNEIFQCQQTPQGFICPQGLTSCNPLYQQPSCPSGTTYNSQTQKCEYVPSQGNGSISGCVVIDNFPVAFEIPSAFEIYGSGNQIHFVKWYEMAYWWHGDLS
ncbi:MAG: hypothetical protein ACPLSN_07620, partial [Dictyoglomus turgidum]